MTVTEIAEAAPKVSYSTISTTITKLWRNRKLVSKTISPESQRVTIVELTDKGRDLAANVMKLQSIRFQTLIKAIMVNDEEKDLLLKILNRAVMFFDKHFESIESRN
jgi:DNA-binding MarR family transcriptional regulator